MPTNYNIYLFNSKHKLLSFVKDNIVNIMIFFRIRRYTDIKLLKNCHNDIIKLKNTHHIKQIGADGIKLFFNEKEREQRLSLKARLNGINVNTPCVNSPEIWYSYLAELSAYSEIGDIDSARKIIND